MSAGSVRFRCSRRAGVTCSLPSSRRAWIRRPLSRPAAAMFRGVVRRSWIVVGPIFTVRLGPSVRNTAFAGTCSDKPEDVGRVGPRGLQPGAVASGQGLGHGVGGRREQPEHRVLLREVVHPAGEAADRSLPGEPVQGEIDRLAAAEVQEVSRNEHGTTSRAVDAGKYS